MTLWQVILLIAQLRHQHSTELKCLGTFQGQSGGPVAKKYQPDKNKHGQCYDDYRFAFKAIDLLVVFFQAVDNDRNCWRDALAAGGYISDHRQVGAVDGAVGNPIQTR